MRTRRTVCALWALTWVVAILVATAIRARGGLSVNSETEATTAAAEQAGTNALLTGLIENEQASNAVGDAAARAYSDGSNAATLTAAASYSDGSNTAVEANARTYSDGSNAATLVSAQAYTDGSNTAVEANAFAAAQGLTGACVQVDGSVASDGKAITNLPHSLSFNLGDYTNSGPARIAAAGIVSASGMVLKNLHYDLGGGTGVVMVGAMATNASMYTSAMAVTNIESLVLDTPGVGDVTAFDDPLVPAGMKPVILVLTNDYENLSDAGLNIVIDESE